MQDRAVRMQDSEETAAAPHSPPADLEDHPSSVNSAVDARRKHTMIAELRFSPDHLQDISEMVGIDDKQMFVAKKYSNASRLSPGSRDGSRPRRYFPFKQGHLVIATLRVGVEGIQMTFVGKHTTSFAYRESLEPWLLNEVRVSGDIKLISVLARGLPTSEDLEHVIDLKTLKAPPSPLLKRVDLFIGIISTANNFKRRIAVGRTWMQYDAVRSGDVAVPFLIGLSIPAEGVQHAFGVLPIGDFQHWWCIP